MLKFVLRTVMALVVAATGLVLTQSPALAATVGPVYIWGYDSQKCIDNPNSSTANGTVQIIFSCYEPRNANQSWTFITTEGKYWNIKNGSSGKCLTVKGASTENSAAVIQYTCNNGDNEEWYTEYTGIYVEWGWRADYYRIINRKSGKCLTVKNASTSNSAQLLQYTCNGGTNQNWSWAPDLRLHG
ncbi:hypothetical protein GCM10010112_20360 [Actinoplanes lobatus]|uniref:Ricin B lectin domain-containing protein n=1 Tax=Actinoplanes lobatus TaxID=113568 RepID=A0A7W7MLF8_9ACTN|nr:RICIN domain-containing protein [Actinoplanes lobatus]MBB4754291.1 hypothetical protein [Actinoplanes lobatus]GGN62322.1 hypothetical protein GCM10010112_20360 [Actinoplanes lobatus]GIE46031.1 hypothetical protein Alo02nite_89290 [Actinoplanes lobatus]